MPIRWALANPNIGERVVLAAMLEVDADLLAAVRDGTLPEPSLSGAGKAATA
ncbi:hypothetical protein [Streptomyces sp. R33]|uniref:Uncharacterized protein n=1 Tax=Streptomyces sp. R33 TaxID=3238629 RepID=A0AB39XXG0_9ACTN